MTSTCPCENGSQADWSATLQGWSVGTQIADSQLF